MWAELYSKDYPPIILIGHSMGGAIAVRTAATKVHTTVPPFFVQDNNLIAHLSEQLGACIALAIPLTACCALQSCSFCCVRHVTHNPAVSACDMHAYMVINKVRQVHLARSCRTLLAGCRVIALPCSCCVSCWGCLCLTAYAMQHKHMSRGALICTFF